MSQMERSNKELKLTAAIYASRPGLVAHVKTTGKLPEVIPTGGAEVALKVIIQKRGTDIQLTPDEELVYDAIIKEKRLVGGSVILIEDEKKRQRENEKQSDQ